MHICGELETGGMTLIGFARDCARFPSSTCLMRVKSCALGGARGLALAERPPTKSVLTDRDRPSLFGIIGFVRMSAALSWAKRFLNLSGCDWASCKRL